MNSNSSGQLLQLMNAALLVNCPEMTYKTGQMSMQCQQFNMLMFRDRWADVDETWHIYSMVVV